MQGLKRFKVIFCLLLLIISQYSCQRKKSVASTECSRCCLNKLLKFATDLKIDTSKNFQYYFAEDKFSLGDCSLKKFRGDRALTTSIVLIWLKVDAVYLKHNWKYSYVQDHFSDSKTSNQIMHEFYFMTTKRTPEWIEQLDPDAVNDLITNDKTLLNNKQIYDLYTQNNALRINYKPNL